MKKIIIVIKLKLIKYVTIPKKIINYKLNILLRWNIAFSIKNQIFISVFFDSSWWPMTLGTGLTITRK